MIKKTIYICPNCQKRLKYLVDGFIMYLVCKKCGIKKKHAKLVYFNEREVDGKEI